MVVLVNYVAHISRHTDRKKYKSTQTTQLNSLSQSTLGQSWGKNFWADPEGGGERPAASTNQQCEFFIQCRIMYVPVS